MFFEAELHRSTDFIHGRGLHQKLENVAFVDGLEEHFGFSVACQEDTLGLGTDIAHPAEEIEALLTRHIMVTENDLNVIVLKDGFCFSSGLSGMDFILSGQQRAEIRQQGPFVFDDEHPTLSYFGNH